MDKLSLEQRHRNMSNIRSKDTKIEEMLRKALWQEGYRYRKNYKWLPGKTDIVITKYKVAIFCDSEFFHGKNFVELAVQLNKSQNSDFWIDKIHKNIKHDKEVEMKLRAMGWTMMSLWGKDILKNLDSCLRTIEEVIFDLKLQDIVE